MDMPFEGIPTVPPPKDRDHMAFFAGGCRYLVSAKPSDSVAEVKRRLFAGGIARAYPGEVGRAEDLELYYACVRMEEAGAKLEDYRVPPVRIGGRCCSFCVCRRHAAPSFSVSLAPQLKEKAPPLRGGKKQPNKKQQGCKTMIALSTALMKRGLPPKESAYWH